MLGRTAVNSELPMCCRTCAERQSQYMFPAWDHTCLKHKPMQEGCRWKRARTTTLEEANERRD